VTFIGMTLSIAELCRYAECHCVECNLYIAIIVSKVPKGDNLLLGPQTFIVKTLMIQNAHSRYFYTQMERRGNRQTARETEKERVRVCEYCRKTDIGVRHKTGRWKNPLTSFEIS
jgi:hypothetical protein